jgi:stage V sporulation protein G
MNITEVRIKLMEAAADRLRAFCSITFDNCFVVRDLKIIEGNNGLFVAMPSRKIMVQCPQCGTKNHLRARYCNQCGGRVTSNASAESKSKLYADIAHPINVECREMIQGRVIKEFELETERAKLPGYVSRYDEEYGNIEPGPAGSDVSQIRRVDHATPLQSPPAGQPHAAPDTLPSRPKKSQDMSNPDE